MVLIANHEVGGSTLGRGGVQPGEGSPVGGADFRLRFPYGLVLEWSGEADSGQLTRLVNALA